MSQKRNDMINPIQPIDANDPSTWKKGEDETWGDKFLRPDRPLTQRHRELARLAALGKSNKEICEKLNYTPSRVSILLTNSKIKDEIERYKDKLFTIDTQTRLKELAPDALNVMEEILTSPSVELKDKENSAKWLLEKVSGKAAQQVDIKGEVSIGVFLDKLDQMKARESLPQSTPINIIPKSSEVVKEESVGDNFEEWLDKNLEPK